MVKVLCKYLSISEIPTLNSKKKYEKIVSPLDYIYSFEKGRLYNILGITQFSGILMFYLIPNEGYEIDIGPAVLFECNWGKTPENWQLRVSCASEESFDILPEKLSLIDGWFEKYVDDDPEVLQLIKSEINDIRQKQKEDSALNL